MKLILKKPVITEKSSALQENQNHYTFIVDKNANKINIRKEVEKKFSVKVDSVYTMNYRGKTARVGRNFGRKSDFKKAIVSLREGEKLNFYEEN